MAWTIDPALPLGEAIRALRVQSGEADMTDVLSPETVRAMQMHDAVHVVFDCDDSLPGEISSHIWMAFATTAPLAEMHRAVASREHRTVLSGIGHFRLLTMWLALVPRLARILWRSRKMTGRLPYDTLPSLMDVPVTTIRERFGIRLISA